MDREKKGLAEITSAVVLWSTIEVATKYLDTPTPLSLAFTRFAMGSVLLFPLVLRSTAGEERIGLAEVGLGAVGGFLGITLTFSLYHISLMYTRASTVATIISAVPLFVLPMSICFLGEKASLKEVLGIVGGGVGLALLAYREANFSGSPMWVSFALGSVASFSAYTLINRELGKRKNPGAATSLSLLFGTVLFLPVLIVEKQPLFPIVQGPSTILSFLIVLYLGFIATGAGYLLFFRGMDTVSAHRGASLIYLKPVLATSLAFLFLGEKLGWLAYVAIALVVLSLAITVE